MSETIGRVDFIADLDGRGLSAKAKALAKEIGAAGDDAGNEFGDRLESSFNKRLSKFGQELSDSLEKDGRRAGETFGDSLDTTLQSRFRRMQSNLADILTDEASFSSFARGFDNVSAAVDRATDDLEELRNETVLLKDDNGKLVEQLVLTEDEFRSATLQIRELGDATQAQIDRDNQFAESQRSLGRETDELNAKWNRLTRLVADGASFGQAAERMGGIEEAHRKLRLEIEQGGAALGRTQTEIEGYVDRLDLTRDRALKVAAAVAEADRQHNSFGRTVSNLSNVISKPWQNLDNDVRLVIGLIASAADQIAALGSAGGAGLISVGSSIASLGVGLSGVIPVFLALNREASELPPHLREVAAEFDLFKQGFKETASVISTSAFKELPGTFDSLRSSLRGLDPEFSALGTTVGRLGSDLGKALAPGTEGFADMQQFIRSSTPLFDSLARSAGTLGGALIRSFNRATPLTQDFVGWIDKLIDRFDTFSRSTAFDSWILNAQAIWGDFGELLDATGEALGDLANPSAVANLRSFMDDLTEFMPRLATGLNVIGELNILGLVAQALNDIGAALEPLAEPLYDLAGAVSDVASIFIGEFAEALGAVASLIAPVIQGGADFLDSLPPGAVEAIADSLILLGGAFLLLKGANAIGGAITALGLFGTAGTAVSTSATKMTSSLKGLAGKAGLFGLVAVGAVVGAEAILEWGEAVNGVDNTARNAVGGAKSLSSAFTDLSTSQAYLMDIPKITNWNSALDSLNDGWGRFFGVAGTAGAEAQRLAEVLNDLDAPLAELARNSLPEAKSQFQAWAKEVGASDQQVLNMLNELPEFKQILLDVGGVTRGLATDQELVAIALGEAAGEAANGVDAFGLLGSAAILSGDGITALDDKIQNFVANNLEARSAARDYEAAIDELTASIAENGNNLDISTEAGRNNEAAIDALVAKTMSLSEETRLQTGSQFEANQVIRDGRQALIDQLAAFGITGVEAEAYADKLGLIAPDVTTEIITPGLEAAQEAIDILSGSYDSTTPLVSTAIQTPGMTAAQQGVSVLTGQYADVTPYVDTTFATPGLRAAQDGADVLNSKIRKVPTSWNTNFTVTGGIGAVFPKTAVGGTFHGAQIREIAEDGPEAVVPLNRPLAQVDPSVRMLSAFAQGLLPTATTSEDTGRQVTFMAGAIVVQGADDPRRAAIEVANEIAELIGS